MKLTIDDVRRTIERDDDAQRSTTARSIVNSIRQSSIIDRQSL